MESATIIAAWWGAIIATLALLWEIFQWFSRGPKIRICVNANMRVFSNPEIDSQEKYIFVAVDNVGDRATTITHFGSYEYDGFLNRLFGKPKKMAS